ncbi:helix-turn-helix domain-containing protein [Cryptosporangium arvum]|uniref:helix-turn-helix domain-containing protein n=1 Tax=Cryptosporangium arvum TaxID=80871 RepID=UPI0012ED1B34|nr:helix-turn-helix domain-containing protein [Cryptosporangium arvum]
MAADEWLARSVPALVPGVVAALVDHLPVYASLPPEELRRDITGVVRQSLRGFARYLREGVLPEGDDLLALRESATRRAEEGLPLGTVVDAYFFGAQHVLDEVARRAGPHEAAGLPGLCGAAFAYLRPVVGAVLTGYLHHANASGNTDRDARQALLAALLDGRPPADHTAISRPAGYLVLSIGIAPHPDETVSGVDPAVAASRKLRRLRTELHHLTRGRALTRLSSTGGLVLVPIATAPGGLTDDDWQHLRSDVDRLRRHCAAELTVGAVAADPPGVAAAARLAAEVREVATAAGRGPGVHRLPDVLLEYQLSRPGPARDQLASLLDPLAGRPELLDTLRTFFECALDRRRTGAALCVHPNTVDYRLRKITALTGLDTVPGPGTAMLHAALTARAHG